VLVASSFATATAHASTPAAPVTSQAVTMDGQGWLHYNRTEAAGLALRDVSTITVVGTETSNHGCAFKEAGIVYKGSLGIYTEQIALNPTLCQEKLLLGKMTPTSLATLQAADEARGQSIGVNPAVSAAATRPGIAKSAISAPAATAARAYEKTSYVDPAFLTITSLSANLTWYGDGVNITSASYADVPYMFRYDGWRTIGNAGSAFTFRPTSVSINPHMQFLNSDFQRLLVAMASGNPLLAAAVRFACGPQQTAVFSLNEFIQGNSNQGFNWGYADAASGGCSQLVHHNHYSGFGSSN
jgi:hypothetical protein